VRRAFLFLTCVLLARVARAEDAPLPVLRDGVGTAVAMKEGRSTWSARVDVPVGARALFVVAASDGDLDLFVKRGRPVFDEFEADADAFHACEGCTEVVALGSGERPAPASGPWYVTLEHPRAAFRGASGEVVALVDGPTGARTVLPGHAAQVRAEGGPATLRTWLPPGARGLRLTLLGTGADAWNATVIAPSGASRTQAAVLPILVDAAEAEAGLWRVEVGSRPGAEAASVDVKAEVEWILPKLAAPSDAPLLKPEAAQLLLLGGESPRSKLFRVEVPEGWGGFVVEEHNDAEADVDLYVRRDAPPERPEEDADWMAVTSAETERLVVAGQRPLAPGTYFVQAGTYEAGPIVSSLVLRSLPAPRAGGPEALTTWGGAEPPLLKPDAWVRGTLDSSKSGFAWFAVDPPEGTRSLHAVLLDAEAPFDLVLARPADGSVLSRSVTGRVDERLDQAFPAPLPAGRRFLLGVLCLTPDEAPSGFRLAVGFDAPPALPSDFTWPNLLTLEGLTPDERVAAATVELTGQRGGGGSATCISPRGLLLSCRHVLEDPEEPGHVQRDGVLVAFNRRLDRPPVQCFQARVVFDDEALDLALLEITEDVFGRAPPKDLVLPWLELGSSDGLRLGDPVTVFGYPQDGSEFSRTPVILSRGSVAGFESTGGCRSCIKTDAWIAQGHSGGTLVDKDRRLVAVPVATLGGREAMGLAVPIGRLPAPWKARLKRDLEGGDR
jgi:S1-C subfamily serine protease